MSVAQKKRLAAPIRHPENPVVFLDITIAERPAGRIYLELFKDVCPKTAENFRQFCTGEARNDQGAPIGYKNCIFHRVIRGFVIQSGDFPRHGEGTGRVSIYGDRFEDENFQLKHDRPGLLSMANSGPDTNGCQFFITCAACASLDEKHVVFGSVLGDESLLVVRKIEHTPVSDDNERPRLAVAVVQCGEM